MPYLPHPSVETPPDEAVLWRYLSCLKCIDLIERSKLWLSLVSKFEDPLEGTFTDAEILYSASSALGGRRPESELETAGQLLTTFANLMCFVNCWREGDEESMAMWDLYGKGEGTIAIKSTVGLLKETFSVEQMPVLIGRVRYFRWSTERSTPDHVSICFRKDSSYEHEREVRVAIIDPSQFGGALSQLQPGARMVDLRNGMPAGLEVDFDAATSITEIVIGPREQDRMQGLVESVLARYGVSINVRKSTRLRAR
jgi:hypothetical protein